MATFISVSYIRFSCMIFLPAASVLRETNEADNQIERVLIEQARNGDHGAFGRIVTLYQKKIYRIAYGFFANTEDAMEIVQETFLRVYEKLDLYDEGRPFYSWIYRIAYNLCIDHYRKFQKNKREFVQENASTENIISPISPEYDVEIKSMKRLLIESLKTLNPKQKMIVVMHHFQGMKLVDIAETLGISAGTVKTLHHRALNNLKSRIKKSIGEGEML